MPNDKQQLFLDRYQSRRAQGASNADIAAEFGIQVTSLFRRLYRYGVDFDSDVQRNPPPHGSIGRYDYHQCRCDKCRAENAARQKRFSELRAVKRRRGDAEFKHGYSAYTNWGCRCWICSDAHSERMRRNRDRRRARSES